MPSASSPAQRRTRGRTPARDAPGLFDEARGEFARPTVSRTEHDALDGLRHLARRALAALAEDVRHTPDRAEAVRAAHARAVTATVAAAYWGAVTGGGDPGGARRAARVAPCPAGVGAPVLADVSREAAALGAALATCPKPLAAYAVGTLYTILLPTATRSELGAFFTPPAVADRLLDMAEAAGADWARHAVLDPAAGGGAFLVPAAVRMAARLRAAGHGPRPMLATICRRLRGFELDPFSAWLTWVFLEVALWDVCVAAGAPGRPLRLKSPVRCCDALDAPGAWEGAADVVLGNPPYGKVTLTPALRARYARSLYGHANLYGLFFDLAVRLAAPGGVIGLVAPASFLGGQYFTNLRALLAAEAPPLAIDFIADRAGVFEDVLQETVLVTFRRVRAADAAPEPASAPVRVHFARTTGAAAPVATEDAGVFPLSADGGAPWLLPRAPADAALLHRLAAMRHRLADYGYRVSTGPLVWNRHKPQLTTEGGSPDVYPLVWAESVLPMGEFRFSATRRNHTPYVRAAASQAHLLTREPCTLVQRTTAKEQDRRLVAAVLPAAFVRAHGGVVIENHVNVVRNGRPADPACAGAATLDAVAMFLNSAAADRVFRCISGSVAVSAYELSAMPVPTPEVMRALSALVAEGTSRARCERMVAEAYGLTEAGV